MLDVLEEHLQVKPRQCKKVETMVEDDALSNEDVSPDMCGTEIFDRKANCKFHERMRGVEL
ncbi:hypothetical protein AN958_12912 [Leucoagaricus sp. SymC.cos]|nr:hypothetical protein AN958_12912 [Leucoagaricus sp. SymC.cos]